MDVWQTNVATRQLAGYAYDAVSRVTQKTFDISGVTVAYTFDTAGRLDTMAHDLAGTLDDVTLDYDRNDAGQVTTKDITNANYIWSPPADTTDNYVANALNQYSSSPLGSPTYDSNGNLTSDGVLTFIYDAENRLTEAKNGAVTLGTYEYDPLGRRSEKTASGVTTEYLYAGAQVLAEYDGGGDLVRRYVYGPGVDDPIAVLNEAGNVTYFHSDGLGSIIALSNAAGANTDIFTHGPYGEVDTNSGGSAFKYTARRIDEETGLYYYRNRYYHPDMGRFLTADPIGYGGGLNMYAYVGNDPMNFTDPSGLVKADEEVVVKGDFLRGGSLNGSGVSFGGYGAFIQGLGVLSGGDTKGTRPANQARKADDDEDEVEEIVVTGTRGTQSLTARQFLDSLFLGPGRLVSILGGGLNVSGRRFVFRSNVGPDGKACFDPDKESIIVGGFDATIAVVFAYQQSLVFLFQPLTNGFAFVEFSGFGGGFELSAGGIVGAVKNLDPTTVVNGSFLWLGSSVGIGDDKDFASGSAGPGFGIGASLVTLKAEVIGAFCGVPQ